MLLTKLTIALALLVGTRQTNYVPKAGFVPDKVTACAIARAIYLPIYGPKNLKLEEPLIAQLRGDIWIVKGSIPKLKKPYAFIGGVVEVHIDKKTGSILYLTHPR